jgi:hypothetical protein
MVSQRSATPQITCIAHTFHWDGRSLEHSMPLTKKGQKIKREMKEEYGDKEGEQVFHASANKGTIKGVKKGRSKKS